MTAEDLIKLLNLKPHPEEGGFYRETYRSAERVALPALPRRYTDDKSFSTSIYYLLTPGTFSAFHRLPTDEIFHFYMGDPVQMLQLYQDGHTEIIVLGHDIRGGEVVQVVVPKGVWQGSFLKSGGTFALLGATMAPGFDFADYESADRNTLVEQYRDHKDLIVKLTKS